jgi:uncharacterized membrane protein
MNYLRTILKKRFLAGLAVLIPIIITVKVIIWLFTFVDGLLGPLFNEMLGYYVSGLGFISVIALVYIIGVVSANVFGKRLIALMEVLFLKLPVFKGVYTAIKQLVDAFAPENSGSFKRFVIAEYPRKEVFAFGFLTKECITKIRKDGVEVRLMAVYIPTNNLYLGEIVLLNESDVFYTDISIEDGIKLILSGGIAAPPRIFEAR